MSDRSSGNPDRSTRAPPSSAQTAAHASSTQGGGGASLSSGNRRFSLDRAADSSGSGNCNPTRPVGRQAMPHFQIGVSNRAKPESLMVSALAHRRLHSHARRACDRQSGGIVRHLDAGLRPSNNPPKHLSRRENDWGAYG